MFEITVTSNEDRQRLDRFLKKYLSEAPLSLIYRMIRKDIKVTGRRVRRDDPFRKRRDRLYTSPSSWRRWPKEEAPSVSSGSLPSPTRTPRDRGEAPSGLLWSTIPTEKKDDAGQPGRGLPDPGGQLFAQDRARVHAFPVHRLTATPRDWCCSARTAWPLRTLSAHAQENGVQKFYQTIVVGA